MSTLKIPPIRRVVEFTECCKFCKTLLPGGVHRGDCPYSVLRSRSIDVRISRVKAESILDVLEVLGISSLGRDIKRALNTKPRFYTFKMGEGIRQDKGKD